MRAESLLTPQHCRTSRPDPEFRRLVGEVVLDSGIREVHDADRHDRQRGIALLERSGGGIRGRFEGNLRDRPFCSARLSAFQRGAVEQNHVVMFRVDLVEPIPDGETLLRSLAKIIAAPNVQWLTTASAARLPKATTP